MIKGFYYTYTLHVYKSRFDYVTPEKINKSTGKFITTYING